MSRKSSDEPRQIPVGFDVQDDCLVVGGTPITELLTQHGSPLFVYSSGVIKDKVASVRSAFPDRLSLSYAVKANPFGPLLQEMQQLCDGMDVGSIGEARLAQNAGAPPHTISFAGPGKSDLELSEAIQQGITINCESLGECDRALRIADALGVRPALATRVNPDFELGSSLRQMAGQPTQFGMEPHDAITAIRRILSRGADWRGLHIFCGSQCLDADALAVTHSQILGLAASIAESIDLVPPTLNLGGGFGIPYFLGEQPLDIVAVGDSLAQLLDEFEPQLPGTNYSIELGRFLVGESGVYLTTILDRKSCRGEVFLITDGGMHHNIGMSLLVSLSGGGRSLPVAVANKCQQPGQEVVNVVGRLCTPVDQICMSEQLPIAEPGDVIAAFCAGAYAASASPGQFIGHGPCKEVLVA